MQNRSKVAIGLRVVLTILLLHPEGLLLAQEDKVAAFKQAMAENQKLLSQYQWIETTIVSMKGEEKSRTQKLCSYGPDGQVQKQQISAPAPQQSPGGLKGKAVAKKKEEITDYMKQAVALVHSYVPPDPGRVQTAKESGKITASPVGQGSVRLDFHDFVKPGDSMSLTLDTGKYAIQDVSVKSYLDSQKDTVSLDVGYALLPDGVSYSARTLLNAPAKNIQVTVQNSDYQSMVKAQAPPPQKQQGPAPSPQQIDQLTGSIALYPDALIAQILDASTDLPQLKSFAGWLNQNSSLKGSALQEAAQKAGFDGPYIALAVFPQIVQMMDQKPEWTDQLGQAYIADSQAVSESIQRLRKQAQAMGNLKTNPQQEVVTQKTSGGEQVIVIQPANPQIVYVPQYNPQIVYVQSAPPPPPSSSANAAGAALIGFTAGIIIGAAASNNCYYGPYAWHRPPVAVHYNYSHYQQQRYENASNLQANRQNNVNQAQTTSQANQANRQSTSQANQTQRQSASQTNQAQRQSTAQGMQSSSQANQAQRQSNLRAQQSPQQRSASSSTRSGGQSASQRSGMNSSSMSAYQSGATAKSQSARGSSSLSSSRKSGGGRSRSR
jgi:hypothetical protein